MGIYIIMTGCFPSFSAFNRISHFAVCDRRCNCGVNIISHISLVNEEFYNIVFQQFRFLADVQNKFFIFVSDRAKVLLPSCSCNFLNLMHPKCTVFSPFIFSNKLLTILVALMSPRKWPVCQFLITAGLHLCIYLYKNTNGRKDKEVFHCWCLSASNSSPL